MVENISYIRYLFCLSKLSKPTIEVIFFYGNLGYAHTHAPVVSGHPIGQHRLIRGDPAQPQWTEPAQARLSPTYGRTRMPIDWHARTPGPESTRSPTQGLSISIGLSSGLEPETNGYYPLTPNLYR